MSLANRLSLYFLAALVIVLAGFSLTLYLLVRMHLYAQFNDRLDAAMKELVAAVEVHPHDVQWEPLERRITVGEDAAADQPRWTLHDLSGRLKDRSSNLAAEAKLGVSEIHGWRVLDRRMRAGSFTAEVIDGNKESLWIENLADSPIGDASTIQLPEDRTFESDGLVFTVAASEASVLAMLRWLAFVLVGVSATIWITAALWGRWLCRRALLPISQMAASARSISRDEAPTQMLNVPSTRDELSDLGQAFNELLSDLRESLERQRRFTGDASHQLRTPLTALLASVDVALRHERSPTEYQRVLEIVQRRGGQLRQIIESLLFLARSDGTTLLGAPERIDLNHWCQSWLDVWTEHPRAGDLTFRPSACPAIVTTHSALLGQILDNLLDNASKYSEPGTPIVVSVETKPELASITISDSGCGVAADQQALIFEPFFRTTEARWQGKTGVGLGLAVVQRLAGILDAKVEVLSEPGKGSSFRILLLPHKEHSLLLDSKPSENETTAKTGQYGKSGFA